MTSSYTGRRSKEASAADSGTSTSSGRNKRKHENPAGAAKTSSESNQQTGRSRASPSITNLFSSQKSDDDSSDEPRPAKRRSLQRGTDRARNKSKNTVQPPSPASFAEMYNFKTKNSGLNGVVDLTVSSLPNTPTKNGLHKTNYLSSTFNSHQGPKKLVVKNIRPAVREDKTAFFERKWKEQDAALDTLFAGNGAKLLLEELYKGAEFVCRQGLAKELYTRLRQKCSHYLDKRLREGLRSESSSSTATSTLRSFVETWMLWQNQLQTIRNIFFYLNQTYLARSTEETDLEVAGFQLFRSIVFQDEVVRTRVLQATITMFDNHRRGTCTPEETKLIQQAISTFHDLAVYSNDFEPIFCTASGEFYNTWRSAEAEKNDLPHYVRSCSLLLEQEHARCVLFGLDATTKGKLSTMFNETMVEDNLERLTAEDALLDMMEANMIKELEQTYLLLKLRDQQLLLREAFAKFIETEGASIVFDEKREIEMVVRLLEYKRKLDLINRTCFYNNEMLGNTLHKSFEIFMNKTKKTQATWDTDNAKPGEMIAKHVDLLMKGGPKAVPGLRKTDAEKAEEENDFDNEEEDAEVEKHLDAALDLFRFVQGKAVFEAFYKKDLARRLLMGRTQSFDAERSMLAKLRNECGSGFTHNLESMFKDMDLAREEMKSYNQLLMEREIKSVPDLSVNVLSAAAWPTYPDIPVNIPTSITKVQANFENHYKSKHVGRKLSWKPALAHCQLKSNFPKGKKEIVVSGFQAVVLLLFNDVANGDSLSYSDISTATALPDAELVRTLQSLACAKYRVLSKSPKSRDVKNTDTFSFNSSFADPKVRIKINQIQLKETKEENKETHQRVAADRHYETQAAIVRIMKAKKTIGHNELIVEVIKATRSRGVLDQVDIKKNIEKLIEKEYMERDEDVKNGYRYLA